MASITKPVIVLPFENIFFAPLPNAQKKSFAADRKSRKNFLVFSFMLSPPHARVDERIYKVDDEVYENYHCGGKENQALYDHIVLVYNSV